MNFTDPFNASTDKFKQLISNDLDRDVEYALNKRTVKGLPPDVYGKVKEAQDKLELDKTKKAELSNTFNNLFQDLNRKYGLNVTLDFDSFSKSLNYIIEPNNKRAMEYYLSEAYGRFRVVLYGQYLQAIALLSAQILDPAYLLSESMTYDQKLDTMQKLYEFMATMNEIYKEVNIPDTDTKLEKLSSDKHTTYNLNDPKVRNILEQVLSTINSEESLDQSN